MPDMFQVADRYLHRANLWYCLSSELYCASFPERLLIGYVESDTGTESQADLLKFSKRSISLPSSYFFIFTNCLRRAKKSFDESDTNPWETVLYKLSKSHEVVFSYHMWDEEWRFQLGIRWNLTKDKNFQKKLAEAGETMPDIGLLKDKESVYLKRGCYLTKEDVDVLSLHLSQLLQFAYFENPDTKQMVMDFTDHVIGSPKLRDFVMEKLKEFPELHYQKKVKIMKDLLNRMFEEKEEQKQDILYSRKNYYQILSSKANLVFSLLNCQLN